MSLRWITWGDKDMWHLRFGPDGRTLCDRWPTTNLFESRALSVGAPADRCPKCLDVISLRLGLVR